MSGKRSRTKGHSFERWVANELKHIYPEAKRHLENQVQEALGFDLDNTGKLRIQCKRFKRYAPLTAIKEVKTEICGGIPILITKPDREEALACMPFSFFKELLEVYENKKP